MMPSAPGPARRQAAVAELAQSLRRRFPGARLQGGDAPAVLATGVEALDALLPGGLPRGRVTVLAGPPSSGHTGLALAAAARVTGGGARVAWIDVPCTLHPPSADAAGVELARLVLVRPPARGARQVAAALHAGAVLLGARAVGLVVLDLAGDGVTVPTDRGAWTRLARAVSSEAACLVLAGAAPGGSPLAQVASVVVSLGRARATWLGDGAPARLAGARIRAEVARSRFGGEGRVAEIPLARPPEG